MNCRKKWLTKLCPAARSLRTAFALELYQAGVPVADIAAMLEFRSGSSVTHIVKLGGARLRRPR